jgi:hypothetical protein
VIAAAPLVPRIGPKLLASLGGYGVGPAVADPGFCAPAMLEYAGLEGALMMARELAGAPGF